MQVRLPITAVPIVQFATYNQIGWVLQVRRRTKLGPGQTAGDGTVRF